MSQDAEGHVNFILKNIPLEKIPEVEARLEKLLDELDLSGTFWSKSIIVLRARKHTRVRGQGGKVKIEGYVKGSEGG